jgi:hypothetical protein
VEYLERKWVAITQKRQVLNPMQQEVRKEDGHREEQEQRYQKQ